MELVNVHNSLTELKKNKTINGTLLNYEVGRTASQGSESKPDLEVKLLIITDHEGDLLFKKKLIINYNGLVDSIRGQKDGFAFFGAITHYQGKLINDFILNIKEENYNNLKAKIYFSIFYDRTNKKFFFKGVKNINYEDILNTDLSIIFFYKREKDFSIVDNSIITFNDDMHYFLVEIFVDDSIKISFMEVSKERKLSIIKSYIFDKNEVPISIGKNSKINYPQLTTECFFNYDSGKKIWVVQNKVRDIWLVCDRKMERREDVMYFKLEKNVFMISKEY